MSGEAEIQRALFQAISALGLRVHDVAPQRDGDEGMPLVEVGTVVLAPYDTKDRNGFDFVARIHFRSRARNMLSVKDTQGQVYDRLHHGDLAMTGYRTVLLRREQSDVTRDQDGALHGICQYRGLIETT